MTTSDDYARVLIISPVRNEAEHVPLLARSMMAQSRPPDVWLVIDDGSTDGTLELLQEFSVQMPFMRVISTPPGHTADAGDRHAVAAAPRAFNYALRTVAADGFTHIGKLDGDIELPEDYFELLLREFDKDAALGIGGGVIVERVGVTWRMMHAAPGAVRGALKLYSRECFAAIGGLRECLGWDGIDQTFAQLRGYKTASFNHIVVVHHRVTGSADGLLRARTRGGQTSYIVGFSLPWVLLKSFKQAMLRPYAVSGGAFVFGYLRARWQSVPRIEDAEYLRFVRQGEKRRLLGAARTLAERGFRSPVHNWDSARIGADPGVSGADSR